MRQATRAQWIKCAIAILLYLVFLIWVRSWWGLIDTIQVVLLWDCRQNPDKLKKL